MKEYTCIICPNGCKVIVEDNGNIHGYSCPRGLAYVKQESTHPERTITSTIKVVECDKCRVVPVKTEKAVPKEKIFDVMKSIDSISVKLPIKLHQILIENVCETGVNVIATKEIK